MENALKEDKSLKKFAYSILAFQFLILFLYSFNIRTNPNIGTNHLVEHYPWFQKLAVMMLIGFAYLLAYLRDYSWSSLSYVFFANAVIIQEYPLWSGFWQNVFASGFSNFVIYTDMRTLIGGSYALAAFLIGLGHIIGRVNIFQIFVLALFQMIAYTLNQQVMFTSIKIIDAGGSIFIHTFGAFFGLGVSWILSYVLPIEQKAKEENYNSNKVAMIGICFLFVFFPNFNSALVDTNQVLRMQAIISTILSLKASCVTAGALAYYLKGAVEVRLVYHATLAGGVVVGASANIIENPVAALVIGAVAGIVCILVNEILTPFMQKHKLFDVAGVLNFHGIIGVIGGLYSALLCGIYNTNMPVNNQNISNYSTQGGLQVAGTFASLGIGLGTGIICGYLMYLLDDHIGIFLDAEAWYLLEGDIALPTRKKGLQRMMSMSVSNQLKGKLKKNPKLDNDTINEHEQHSSSSEEPNQNPNSSKPNNEMANSQAHLNVQQ